MQQHPGTVGMTRTSLPAAHMATRLKIHDPPDGILYLAELFLLAQGQRHCEIPVAKLGLEGQTRW